MEEEEEEEEEEEVDELLSLGLLCTNLGEGKITDTVDDEDDDDDDDDDDDSAATDLTREKRRAPKYSRAIATVLFGGVVGWLVG